MNLRTRGARILFTLVGLSGLVLTPWFAAVQVAHAGTIPGYTLPSSVVGPQQDGANNLMYNLIPDSPAVSSYITEGANNFSWTGTCVTATPSTYPEYTQTGCQDYVKHWFDFYLQAANQYPGTQAIIPTEPENDNGTFAALAYGGENYQNIIQQNWWGNNKSVLRDMLALEYDLKTNAAKGLPGKYYDIDAATKVVTLNEDGNTLWDTFKEARTNINKNFGALFRVIAVLHTPTVGGGMWRSDFNFIGVTTIKAQQNLDPTIKRPSNLADLVANPPEDVTAITPPGMDSFAAMQDFITAYSAVYQLGETPSTAVTGIAAADALANVQAAGTGAASSAAGTITADANANPCGIGITTGFTGVSAGLNLAMCAIALVIDKAVNLGMEAATGLLATQGDIFTNIHTGTDGADSFLGQLNRPIQTVVQDPSGFGLLVREIYNRMLQLLNLMLILAMVVIALANILQVGMNNYQIKKILPGLILGFLVANLSFFALRASLEVTGRIAQEVVRIGTTGGGIGANPSQDQRQIFMSSFGEFPFSHEFIAQNGITGPTPDCHYQAPLAYLTDFCGNGLIPSIAGLKSTAQGPDLRKVMEQIIDSLFEIVPMIFLFILGFLFLARRMIFLVLFPTAPLAAFGLFFTPLKGAWDKWFAYCKEWLLLPIIAGFFIMMSLLFLHVAITLGSAEGRFVAYIIGVITLFLAMRAPFTYIKASKDVVEKLNSAGRQVGLNYTPYGAAVRGSARVKAEIDARGKKSLEGPVIKNSLLRKAGGDALNKKIEKRQMRVDKDTELQKDALNELKAEAEKELNTSEGILHDTSKSLMKAAESLGKYNKGVGDSLAKAAKGMESGAKVVDDKLGKYIKPLETFGRALGYTTYQRAADEAKINKEGAAHYAKISEQKGTARRNKRSEYTAHAEALREEAEEAESDAAKAVTESEKHYIEGGLDADTKEFLKLLGKLEKGDTLDASSQASYNTLLTKLVDAKKINPADQATLAGWATTPRSAPSNAGDVNNGGLHSIAKFHEARTEAQKTSYERRKAISVTQGANAAKEKALKDATHEYNDGIVKDESNRVEMKYLANRLATPGYTPTEEEAQRFSNTLAQTGNEKVKEYLKNNNFDPSNPMLLAGNRGHQEGIAKLLGEQESEDAQQTELNAAVFDRGKTEFENVERTKIESTWSNGPGAEAMQKVKSTGDITDLKNLTYAFARHHSGIKGDFRTVFHTLNGVHKGILTDSSLQTGVDAMHGFVGKLRTNLAPGGALENDKVAQSVYAEFTRDNIHPLDADGKPIKDSAGNVMPDISLEKLLADFKALGSTSDRQKRQFISQYKSSPAMQVFKLDASAGAPGTHATDPPKA